MATILSLYTWLQANGATLVAIIMAVLSAAEMIVRLTPTKADDGAVERVGKFVRRVFDVLKVPNIKAEGGQHPTLAEKEKDV